MPTGDGILARARAHIGEKYEHGIAPKDDPDWKGPWDCAEFASWLVFQESGVLYGCPDDVAPAKSDAYTGRWQEDSARKGLRIPVEQAAATPGAMLLRYPPSGGGMGHIAVSDGRGGTVEAMGRRYGVLKGQVAGRRWDTGVLVPGVDYAASGRRVPTPGPAVLFARNLPNMGGEAVKAIQRALKAKGFDPSGIDGDFGEATAQAVQAFQEAQGLVPDGEVGPETAKLLGVNLPGLAGAVAEVVVKGVVGANPLIAVATAVLPSIARTLAGDPGGSAAAAVSRAVAEVAGASDPDAARQRLAENPQLQATLQIRLAEIAAERDRDRTAAEATTRKDVAAADTARRDDEIRALTAQLDDVKNARSSAIDLVKAGGPSAWGPILVSTIVTVGFFAILFLFVTVLIVGKPVEGDQTFFQIVNIAIGALTVAFSTVVTFWLGSSEGSRRKDQFAVAAQVDQNARERERSAENQAFVETMVDKAAAPQPVALPAAEAGPRGSNLKRCLEIVLGHEGGFSNHPSDNGGATRFGITRATLQDWRGKPVSEADVAALELDEAKEIYRTRYWNVMRCDDLPAGVDLLVFDFGVNAGPGTAARILQKTVGAEQDGSIGDATLGATRAMRPREIVEGFTRLKMERYRGLDDWPTFGRGWTARSDGVRVAALDMIAPAMLGPRPLAA